MSNLLFYVFVIWGLGGLLMVMMFAELFDGFKHFNLQQKVFCVLSIGPLIWFGMLFGLIAYYVSNVYICVFNWLGKYDKKG